MNVKLGLKAAGLLCLIVFKDRRLFFWYYSAECLGIEIREDL